MKRGPNPKTFMLMSGGTILLGLIASHFGYSHMTEVEGEVLALRTEVKGEQEVQAELDKAKAKLDECLAKLQHLEQGIPTFAYIPTLMTELERTGKAHGIKVLGVRPVIKPVAPVAKSEDGETMVAKKPYDELTIEVKGLGSYGSVMRWVNALQQFPKIVAARSVQLSPKPDPSQAAASLDMTVELRAYVFKQPQDAVKNSSLANKSASLKVNRNEG